MRLARHLADLAHRRLWQALPRQARRRGLIAVASALAPRPEPAPVPSPPFIVAGFLTATSGLGAWARLCHDALQLAGLPVLGLDLAAAFRQDDARIEFDYRDGAHHAGPGTLLLFVNAPFVPLALWHIGRASVRGKLVVGHWAWELPDVPPEWRAGVPFVHRIIVPSRFTAAAIGALAPNLPTDVIALPAPSHVAAPPSPDPIRNPIGHRPFTALVVFNMASSFARKNPLAAIAAFDHAFGRDRAARLVVKMLNGDTFPAGARRLREIARTTPNVVLDERNLAAGDMRALYGEADVVLSLHRSEGFGLVVAEAMLAGLPVIATDWSGTTDFLSRACGWPVGYALVPAVDAQGEYDNAMSRWAEPDVEQAAHALRTLRGDPQLRQRLGAAARIEAERLFSTTNFAERLIARLGIEVGGAPHG